MASGDLLLLWQPLNNEPPATIPATPDQRNGHPCLDFDATTDEEAVFSGVMPANYAGGGVTVKIHFAISTQNNNNSVWQTSFERIGTGQQDLDADGFAAAKSSGQVASPATVGFVGVASIAHTSGAEMDSVVAGEMFRLKVRRDADSTSATDDVASDAELVALALYET